ncbi:MAG: alpha/beta hydrolase [Muribaculum sp.]|nr:alpha/beta hydrolase [Muribaculum sp.]
MGTINNYCRLSRILNIIILAAVCFVNCSLHAQTIVGDWSGTLELGGGRSLKLVFHISESPSAITMDSPDQGAYGLGCNVLYLEQDSVNLSMPSLMLSYSGRLKDNVLAGTFQQGGLRLPLTLQPGVKKVSRPQTPIPPFPYKEENVNIENISENAVLAGTLTIPENYTKTTPIVVLVSGSGAQNRDEELFEHKPFAVIADYLARNGIASLRYDDRGYGESTGDRANATTENYKSDAEAVVNWIKDQKRFGKIGLIGHSEGGMIAYMLGAKKGILDFIISIAGPSTNGAEILDYQNKEALIKNGLTESQAKEYAVNARKQIESDPSMTWMQYFLKYDPAKDLQELRCPAFIIYGEKDQQVPPSLNLEKAKKYAPKATVKCYPGLNHLMQEATTGNVEEYNSIEQTISPTVLSDILIFINDNAK